MSDAVAAQLITAVIALLGTIFTGVLTYLMAKLRMEQESRDKVTDKKLETAAVKVEEVKTTLESNNDDTSKKLNDLATVAKATHTLVNSNMAIQLELNMKVTRELANLKDTQTARDMADAAEKLYHEHTVKQHEVDEQIGAESTKKGNPS